MVDCKYWSAFGTHSVKMAKELILTIENETGIISSGLEVQIDSFIILFYLQRYLIIDTYNEDGNLFSRNFAVLQIVSRVTEYNARVSICAVSFQWFSQLFKSARKIQTRSKGKKLWGINRKADDTAHWCELFILPVLLVVQEATPL